MIFKSFAAHLILFLTAFIASGLHLGRASADVLQALNETAVIQVKSAVEVEVKKDQIVLGDLMVARGVSEESLNELRDVRLADMPQPGESRSFTAAGLEQVFQPILRGIESRTGRKISLKLPTRVSVVRKVFRLQANEVEQAIKSQLKEMCADCRFEISDLILPVVPADISSSATWVMKLHGELPKGGFSLPLEISDQEKTKRTFWVNGSLTVMKNVAVAARTIAPGEHLHSEDFAMQDKDVTFLNEVPAVASDFTSSVTARAISAGQILWRSSLQRELAVKSGEIVKVIAGSNGWQVTIDGIAQAGAYIGDTINVKIPRTQKLLSGLLTEKGVVEVRQ